ncbi:excinuclease ABC subunit UvrA [Thermodesulfovibrionales bacterium]|nr:excinuclease ABC subunit UvrA [Thermodesulfovibrionales bacterium]
MSIRELIIEGARQNNLKGINLRLPHNKVIAITGVSGSGKSSLAFETIFAEGQWRFIESLSTYARLFLEKLERPDLDAIHNIRPAIALQQKNPIKGSRSTVGTLTELYDLFRVLYSKVAVPYCPKCGKEIRMWDSSQIVSELLERYANEKAIITFKTDESLKTLRQRGFQRAWFNNEIRDISDLEFKASTIGHQPSIEVVLDRLIIRGEPRLADSIETAWKEGKESLKVIVFKEAETDSPLAPRCQLLPLRFSARNSCDDCNIELPEPSPAMFSFNHPLCACHECKGFGNILIHDEDLIVPHRYLSLANGAIGFWEKPEYIWWKEQMIKGAKKSSIDIDKPYNELGQKERDTLFSGNQHFYGINDFFGELENKRYKLHVRVLLSRYRSPVTCPACRGKRLSEDALAFKIGGMSIAELSSLPISQVLQFIEAVQLSPMQREIAKNIIARISTGLKFLERVGLDYLTLNRQAKTLSGGEYQRVNLSNQLSSALTGTLYVLDEPTIGLHPRDTRRIIEVMREISSLGNTVIVVEHDKDIISTSDWIVELGPGGGHSGGEVVFSGPTDEFLGTDTPTAKYIKESGISKEEKTTAKFQFLRPGHLTLCGATGNNLKNINLTIPLRTLTVITGVSGSGKSSLVVDTFYLALARHFRTGQRHPLPYKEIDGLEKIKGIRLIDQTPIGKTSRSNLVTYLKIFDSIRSLFAKQPEARAHGYAAGLFSFNIAGGRCETCKGEGFQKMEMYFFEDIFIKCEDCKGKRYKEDILRVTCRGKNIGDVFEMTVDEALEFFSEMTEINQRLKLLKEIGLGYLRLGQPVTTLSGGESQRLKICAELLYPGTKRLGSEIAKKNYLYILDEPTVGLHHNDILMFMRVIKKLIDAGNTVLLIEHNLDVVGQADWIIDLGPEGGEKGGHIIFEGTPEELRHVANSYTGQYLKEYSQRPYQRMRNLYKT